MTKTASSAPNEGRWTDPAQRLSSDRCPLMRRPRLVGLVAYQPCQVYGSDGPCRAPALFAVVVDEQATAMCLIHAARFWMSMGWWYLDEAIHPPDTLVPCPACGGALDPESDAAVSVEFWPETPIHRTCRDEIAAADTARGEARGYYHGGRG